MGAEALSEALLLLVHYALLIPTPKTMIRSIHQLIYPAAQGDNQSASTLLGTNRRKARRMLAGSLICARSRFCFQQG